VKFNFKNPTIRLQTDEEGLLKLKEKKKVRRFKEQLIVTNSLISKVNTSDKITNKNEKSIKMNNLHDPANVSVISFDVCEISEQITTV